MNLKDTMSDSATEVLTGLTQAVWAVCAKPGAIPRMGVGERDVLKYVLRDILNKFMTRHDMASSPEQFAGAVTAEVFDEVLNGFQSMSSNRSARASLVKAIRATVSAYIRASIPRETTDRHRPSYHEAVESLKLAAAAME